MIEQSEKTELQESNSKSNKVVKSYSLSPETLQKLEILITRENRSSSNMLEELINRAYDNLNLSDINFKRL